MSNQLQAFIPPSDRDAEQALLGSILLNSKLLDEIAGKIRNEFFYDPRHRVVFTAMTHLWGANQPCDTLFVINQIQLQDKVAKAPSGIDQDFLLELISKSSLASSTDGLTKLIREKYLLRMLVNLGDDIKNLAGKQGETAAEILDEAQKKLFEASLENLDKNFVPVSEVLLGSFERLSRAASGEAMEQATTTGFVDLNKAIGGFYSSDLVIVAGRPGMGKTSLILEVTKRVAMKQTGVAVFSLEMSKEQLVDKLISSVSGIDNWKIRTGKLDDSPEHNDFAKLGEAISTLDSMPIWIDDSGSLNVLELRSKARRLKAKHNIGLIIVDYLQLMSGQSGKNYGGNRVQEVSEISRGLKILAKELGLPVIALSQLSRSVEGRDDKRPMLSDLRESGSIEQDADLVLFIHREEMYHKETARKGIADIIIAKNRHGETRSVELAWISHLATFENLDMAKISHRINE